MPEEHTVSDASARRSVRHGRLSYYISFMTNERIIVASTDFERIRLYKQIVLEHAGEAVHLSRRPCPNGTPLIPGVYQCP